MMFFSNSPSETFSTPPSEGRFRFAEIAPNASGGFLELQVTQQSDEFFEYSESTVTVQMRSPDGMPVGAASEILSGLATSIDTIEIQQRDDGGWVIVTRLIADREQYWQRLAVQSLDVNGLPENPPVVFTNNLADSSRPLPPETLRVTPDPDVFVKLPLGRRGFTDQWDAIARPDGTILVASPPYPIGSAREITFQAYDAAGNEMGPRVVHPIDRVAFDVDLIPGPDGSVLVTWTEGAGDFRAAQLTADWEWTPYDISGETIERDDVAVAEDGTITLLARETAPHGDYLTSVSVWMQSGGMDGFGEPVYLHGYLGSSSGSVQAIPLGHDLLAIIDSPGTFAAIRDIDGWRYGGAEFFSSASFSSISRNPQFAVVDGALMSWVSGDTGDARQPFYEAFALPDVTLGTDDNDRLALEVAGVVKAGAGDDTVHGSAQNDVLDGGAGNDSLFGEAGDDVLRVGLATETADGGVGEDLAHVDIFDRMYRDSERPDELVYAALFTLDRDGTLHLSYGEAELTFRSIEEFSFNGFRESFSRIVSSFFHGEDEFGGRFSDGQTYDAGPGNDWLFGGEGRQVLYGGGGDDRVFGGTGADELHGEDGNDFVHGSDPLDNPTDDLRDVIYAGSGDDTANGGYGNDLIYGMDGDDLILGGFGVDELIGQNGNDVITGSAYSDLVFGNAGDDFVNGGFGHDRINGGSGADKFFHAGVLGHGSDWVQDYVAADGDVLLWGGGPTTADDFRVNLAHTENAAGERAGNDAMQEAFVLYKATNQIIWALVDGGGQSSINLQIGGDTFDLLA